MDPTYVVKWSEIIRDVMVSLDATNAGAYRSNHDRFAAALGRLDDGIKRAVATIPAADRILLTYHDSFAYFARRYGMRVLGAVQPSDFSEPSPRDVRRLIDQVREHGVPAIFGSEVFPSAVLKQVARESGATFVDQLRDDELPGAAGSPSHTYIGMLVENVSIMTRALGGDAASLRDVPTAPTWQ
jgi:ABC-type Zn uptake system ZnuABC Zn-binding protein ZnuA